MVRALQLPEEGEDCHDGSSRARPPSRCHYRRLGAEAAHAFRPETGRWPEARTAPALRLGCALAYLGTTAAMIAFVNCIVAGAGVVLLLHAALRHGLRISLFGGLLCLVLLMAGSLAYQRWRIGALEQEMTAAEEPDAHGARAER